MTLLARLLRRVRRLPWWAQVIIGLAAAVGAWLLLRPVAALVVSVLAGLFALPRRRGSALGESAHEKALDDARAGAEKAREDAAALRELRERVARRRLEMRERDRRADAAALERAARAAVGSEPDSAPAPRSEAIDRWRGR